jgi:DNA-binding NarL/FixJ family response regulator
VDEFLDAIAQLLTRRHDPLAKLTAREREVLQLMAQGYPNGEIADKLVITERSGHKHVGNVFAKLDPPQSDRGHRRVLAVPTYLGRLSK